MAFLRFPGPGLKASPLDALRSPQNELLFLLWLSLHLSHFCTLATLCLLPEMPFIRQLKWPSSFEAPTPFLRRNSENFSFHQNHSELELHSKRSLSKAEGDSHSRPNKFCYQHMLYKLLWGKAEGTDSEVRYTWLSILALTSFNLLWPCLS